MAQPASTLRIEDAFLNVMDLSHRLISTGKSRAFARSFLLQSLGPLSSMTILFGSCVWFCGEFTAYFAMILLTI